MTAGMPGSLSSEAPQGITWDGAKEGRLFLSRRWGMALAVLVGGVTSTTLALYPSTGAIGITASAAIMNPAIAGLFLYGLKGPSASPSGSVWVLPGPAKTAIWLVCATSIVVEAIAVIPAFQLVGPGGVLAISGLWSFLVLPPAALVAFRFRMLARGGRKGRGGNGEN